MSKWYRQRKSLIRAWNRRAPEKAEDILAQRDKERAYLRRHTKGGRR